MVTIRKLLLVLLSLTFFVLPEPFGLLQAEGQEKRTLKLIEGAKKEKEDKHVFIFALTARIPSRKDACPLSPLFLSRFFRLP